MGIALGNLSLEQLQKRLHISLSDEDVANFPKRQENCQHIEPGCWHCFDIPLTICCGDMETAIKVRDILIKYQDSMAEQISISLDKDGEQE